MRARAPASQLIHVRRARVRLGRVGIKRTAWYGANDARAYATRVRAYTAWEFEADSTRRPRGTHSTRVDPARFLGGGEREGHRHATSPRRRLGWLSPSMQKEPILIEYVSITERMWQWRERESGD